MRVLFFIRCRYLLAPFPVDFVLFFIFPLLRVYRVRLSPRALFFVTACDFIRLVFFPLSLSLLSSLFSLSFFLFFFSPFRFFTAWVFFPIVFFFTHWAFFF